MASIEDKVVSIKFDNAEFQQKIAATGQSLDILSQKIAAATASGGSFGSGINSAAQSVNLGPIASSVDYIAGKFNSLHVAAAAAIANITNSAISIGKNFINTDILQPMISGGKTRAQNIEQAKFQFRGLGMDVNEVMANAKEAVLGTAYGLGDAAKAAAQFGASGIKAGDDMTQSLKAISGVAAMTGASYSDIAYLFTTSAANGKITNMDFQQFATRGLNAAAAYAKAIGKTEAQVHDMATNGLIDYASFAKVMNDTFGQHATEANQTYTGSLSNMHAAMSRLSASFFTPEMQQQRDLFNALSPVIDKLATAFKPLIDNIINLRGFGNIALIDKLSKFDPTSLTSSFENVSAALRSIYYFVATVGGVIKDAFKQVFPDSFATTLGSITYSFQKLAEHLVLSSGTLAKIKEVFQGVFAVISIGVAIVKGIATAFGEVLHALAPTGGSLLNASAGLGNFLLKAQEMLVASGKLQEFFVKLGHYISIPILYIVHLTESIINFFSGVGNASGDQVSSRFKSIGDSAKIAGDFWDSLVSRLRGVGRVLEEVWNQIANWFQQLGSKIKEQFKPADFNSVIDVINTALIGGIALTLRKFIASGFSLKTVAGAIKDGVFGAISGSISKVTDTLTAMQSKLKSEALMKIAEAIAILSAAMLVLSFINSADLAKALGAMTIGFTELAATLAALEKTTASIGGASQIGIIAGSIVALALAMDLLALAVKLLSTMSTAQLANGLGAVAASLGMLVIAIRNFPDSEKTISASFSISVMAGALLIMGEAVKEFGNMSWEELVKGLGGAAIAISGVVFALNKMPANANESGAAFIAIALGVAIISKAVEEFGKLSWTELVKGLIGVAASLYVVVTAVDAMPPTIGATAEGMVIVGAALIIIGEAIKRIGNLSNGQIIKGLVGIAGAMVILVLALNGFEEAAPGVGAMVVVAGALYILAQVMEQIGKMGLGQIIVSLVGIAGVLAVIGIAAGLLAPVIPEMLGLGAALALVGVGFALFGAAVLGVAMGLQILSVTGVAGMYAFIKGLQLLGEALPMIAAEGAVFIINFAKHLLDGVPTLIKVIGAVLTQLLETVIKLVPLIVKALGVILDGFIKLMYERAPELINAGVWLLTQLLEALNNNIAGYAELGILILSNLIEGIAQGLPSLLQAGADLIVAFLRGLASYETQVIGAAVGLVISMVNAIGQNANRLVDAAANLIISLVNGIFANLGRVADAGAWAIINFLAGLTRDILTVVNAGVNLVITLMQGVANAGLHLISAAATMLFNFLDAVDVVVKANSERITDKGISIGVDMLSGIAKGILDATGLGSVKDAITHVAHMLPGWLQGLLGISSPSKVFADLAKWIPHGVAQGIEDNIDAPKESVVAMANNIVNAFHETLQKIPASLDNLDVLQPTITPVLDLTNVKAGAKDIAGYMTAAGVSANISTDQASYISSVTGVSSQSPVSASSSNPTTLTFQQTINAPAALSTNDIYRQTKSQLVLAKEELGIQ